MQLSNGDSPKTKGVYTGERVKLLRPETYKRVVRLLAEPREHVSYREICRRCHVTDDTVKVIEQREAVPIAARKQSLLVQATRIAKLAADRVEDQIDNATLPQAVVTFGVMTDKVLALSGDASQQPTNTNHLHLHLQSNDLARRFNELAKLLNGDDVNGAQNTEGALPATPVSQASPPALTDETAEQRESPAA